jgi:hypothetical protein
LGSSSRSLKAPNPKLQDPSRHAGQTSLLQTGGNDVFGVLNDWNFFGAWMLEFGAFFRLTTAAFS